MGGARGSGLLSGTGTRIAERGIMGLSSPLSRIPCRALAAAVVLGAAALAGCSSPSSTSTPAPGNAEAVGEAVPTSNAVSIVLGTGYCGGARGSCNGRVSYTVDLAASSLESSTCAQDGDGGTSDAKAKRPIEAAQLARIRAALDKLRFTHSKLEALDGRMDYVYIADSSGVTRTYSPEATCGGDYDKIVAGFAELSEAILGN